MKNSVRYILFAILTTVLSINAAADVKIKARQTMSGQTTENTTYIKGKRSRTEQNMGGMEVVNITQCDLRRGIQLNPQAQVYIIDAWDTDATTTQTSVSGNTRTEVKKGGVITMTITTKDTGETRKMFGYLARHLIITTETESSSDACTPMRKTKMVTDGWYIDAAFALDCDYGTKGGYYRNGEGGCRDKYDIKQIGGAAKRGYPVIEKMTMFDESGKESFTMASEVVELSSATLDAALFDVPAGWREVKDSSALYSSMSSNNSTSSYNSSNSSSQNSSVSNSNMNSTINTINSNNSNNNTSTNLEAKKAGTIRIGLAGVKTGAVGEGLSAAELASAIQNALPVYLKGTKVEIVNLEAKLASALDAEAKEKQCDYVLYATVSHKKGGGGFGGFGKIMGSVVSQTGMIPTGSTVGNVAGSVAAQSIASAASNVKSKDELTLEISLKNGATVVLAKQFKQKAKSNGEDIISPVVEQAATAIVGALGQ